MLVDLGHHAHGVNIEQIVALLASEGRLGGFHFNNRKYADDDLIVGSVNPFELFLIFCELVDSRRVRCRGSRSTSPTTSKPKLEAMVLSVLNLQEAYAKALLVDRAALSPSAAGRAMSWADTSSCSTHSTPMSARSAPGARTACGAAPTRLAELRASGYADASRDERAPETTL